MKLRIFCCLTWLILLGILPATAAEFTVSPLGDGRFSVTGAAMKGVAGIDLIVEYDSSILSGPAVIKGGMFSGTNAMMAANTTKPGSIKIAIIHTGTFNNSGQLLTVNFAGRTGTGGITNMIAKAIDINGAPLQATAFIIPETQQGSSTPPPDSAGYQQDRQATPQPTIASSGTSPMTAAVPSIGSISLPVDNMQPETQKKQELPPAALPAEQYRQPAPRAEENRQPETKQKKSDELKKIDFVSVLERFKAYKGDRNPLILAGLFSKPLDSSIIQDPLVAAADGKTTLKLKVLLNLQEDDPAPNFAASGAKMVSFKSDEATGRWIIELLPAKDSTAATLSILAGNRLMDIPLVTAPLVKGLSFSDQEMAGFAKDFGAGKPLYDLNMDGRHDYLDDYIYAGNLLLTGKRPGSEK